MNAHPPSVSLARRRRGCAGSGPAHPDDFIPRCLRQQHKPRVPLIPCNSNFGTSTAGPFAATSRWPSKCVECCRHPVQAASSVPMVSSLEYEQTTAPRRPGMIPHNQSFPGAGEGSQARPVKGRRHLSNPVSLTKRPRSFRRNERAGMSLVVRDSCPYAGGQHGAHTGAGGDMEYRGHKSAATRASRRGRTPPFLSLKLMRLDEDRRCEQGD